MTDPRTLKIQRALISVSDKTNLVSFGQHLHDHGVEILSTGGTAQALQSAGIPVTEVASLTDMPEMMGGGLKHFTREYTAAFSHVIIIKTTLKI